MSCDYIDPDLRRLFDFQHGLATNKQLRPFGYSPRRIQHLVESGQWTSVLHGVQSSTNGPLNRAMILEAALLFGGGETYLSHRTAAEEWGLTHIESELPIHITVRYGRSSRCQSPTVRPERSPARPVPLGWSTAHPGVIVHRSRAQAHIGVATQPARTSLADTAIDLAVAEPSALRRRSFSDSLRHGVQSVTDGIAHPNGMPPAEAICQSAVLDIGPVGSRCPVGTRTSLRNRGRARTRFAGSTTAIAGPRRWENSLRGRRLPQLRCRTDRSTRRICLPLFSGDCAAGSSARKRIRTVRQRHTGLRLGGGGGGLVPNCSRGQSDPRARWMVGA